MRRKTIPGSGRKGPGPRPRSRPITAGLDRLIEEATADCHDESEQRMGFYTEMEENLALPFETMVLGVGAVVERIELNEAGEIVAICTRDRMIQAISILDLQLPVSPPRGTEWIEAYRRWARGR